METTEANVKTKWSIAITALSSHPFLMHRLTIFLQLEMYFIVVLWLEFRIDFNQYSYCETNSKSSLLMSISETPYFHCMKDFVWSYEVLYRSNVAGEKSLPIKLFTSSLCCWKNFHYHLPDRNCPLHCCI